MTESPNAPSDKPESAEGTEETPSATVADDHPQPPSQYKAGPYPGAYPPPWPYAGFTPPPTGTRNNGLGIASLVIAILALMSVWSVLGGIIGGLVAAALGIVGRGRVKRRVADNGGVAMCGIVLGTLAIVIGLAFIPLWAGFWQFVGGADYVDCMQSAGSDPVRQRQCTDEFRQDVEQKFSITLAPTPSP